MDNRLVSYIRRKRDGNHSPVIVILGETGSGKTCFGINLALALNPEWRPEENLFVSLPELTKKVITSKKQIIIMDEAGIHLNAKRWYSDFNIFFSQIIQTQRYRNNIYIIILPHILFLAKDHRRILNIKIETFELGDKKGFAIDQYE